MDHIEDGGYIEDESSVPASVRHYAQSCEHGALVEEFETFLADLGETPDRDRLPIRRIVLADDSLTFLQALQHIIGLSSSSRVCGAATTCEAALELVKTLKPDTAILDIHMPVMGGYTLFETLRARDYRGIIIALTGDDNPAVGVKAEMAGADYVSLKSELLGQVGSLLGRREVLDVAPRGASSVSSSATPSQQA